MIVVWCQMPLLAWNILELLILPGIDEGIDFTWFYHKWQALSNQNHRNENDVDMVWTWCSHVQTLSLLEAFFSAPCGLTERLLWARGNITSLYHIAWTLLSFKQHSLIVDGIYFGIQVKTGKAIYLYIINQLTIVYERYEHSLVTTVNPHLFVANDRFWDTYWLVKR